MGLEQNFRRRGWIAALAPVASSSRAQLRCMQESPGPLLCLHISRLAWRWCFSWSGVGFGSYVCIRILGWMRKGATRSCFWGCLTLNGLTWPFILLLSWSFWELLEQHVFDLWWKGTPRRIAFFFLLGTYYVHSYLVLPRMLFSYLDSYTKVASPQN